VADAAGRPIRRAGEGRLEDGGRVVWTMSEGRRGRRWREVVVDRDGALRHSLLLETDPAGRFSHLELGTAVGLLTLHPEGDRTLHGNRVGADGVGHIAGLPWSVDDVLVVDDSPIAAAAAVHGLAGGRLAPGGAIVDDGLELRRTDEPIVPTEPGRWRVGRLTIGLDADGCPLLAGGSGWPLELA